MPNRRDFLKTGFFAVSGTLLLPGFIANHLSQSTGAAGLQGLMPFIVFDDCTQLVAKTHTFSDQTKSALQSSIIENKPANVSRLAVIVPQDKAYISDALLELKTHQAGIASDEFWQKKHAFTLGWTVSHAINNVFDPVIKKIAGNNTKKRMDIQIYHDVNLLRHNTKVVKRPNTQDETLSLFMAMFPRMIGRVHTLEPDPDDGANWVVRMSAFRQENKTILDKYAAAYTKPAQDKLERYIDEINFYDHDDDIFSLTDQQIAAYDGRVFKNKSLVAKALNHAYHNVYIADRYLAGKLRQDALEKELI